MRLPLAIAVMAPALLWSARHHQANAFGIGIGLRTTATTTASPTTTMGMGNSFGRLFRISTWGESHGGGVGVTLDGCPPKIPLSADDIQIGARNAFVGVLCVEVLLPSIMGTTLT